MIKAPPTPKGFRDIGPQLAKKRASVIGKIVSILEEFGFVPIETPILEFAETLTGKYGEEERLIYEFEDRGGRELALRYDLTVPLARFVASNLNLIAKGPFRRYQIGQVFRGENPQRGRWREFTQLDFDTVGSSDPQEDARVIAAALKASEAVGLANAKMLINDRKIFWELVEQGLIKEKELPSIIRSLDKIKKIGKEGIIDELVKKGFSKNQMVSILQSMEGKKLTGWLEKIFFLLAKLGVEPLKYEFSPTLARGLDYYTSTIFELVSADQGLSLGGGGRYDNLIGMFAKREIPAVGFSFGLDRLVELLPDEPNI